MIPPDEHAGPTAVIRLRPGAISTLLEVVDMLDGVGGDHDPAARRLTPVAYSDDPEAELEFSAMTAAELQDGRADDRAVVRAGLAAGGDRVELGVDEAEAWMRVVGEARLAIAARLGIDSEAWESADPIDHEELALLHALSRLQESLVEILTGWLDG